MTEWQSRDEELTEILRDHAVRERDDHADRVPDVRLGGITRARRPAAQAWSCPHKPSLIAQSQGASNGYWQYAMVKTGVVEMAVDDIQRQLPRPIKMRDKLGDTKLFTDNGT